MGFVEFRPSASKISSVVVFLPTFRTKSEAATIPTNLLFLRTGNRLILLLDIILADSFSDESGSTVISVLVITSVTLTSRELLFATILHHLEAAQEAHALHQAHALVLVL